MTRPVALVSLALALAGCSPFAPRPDPSRFFVLTALADGEGRTATAPLDGVVVGLGPVVLPDYLRRPQLATRIGPNQVQFAEYARWGESLDTGVVRVLAQDLGLLLGSEQIVAFPWFGAVRPTYAVDVEVQQFEPSADGSVHLVARWHVRDIAGKTVVEAHDTSLTEPAAAGDPAAAVAALSRTLAALARELADALGRLPARPASPGR